MTDPTPRPTPGFLFGTGHKEELGTARYLGPRWLAPVPHRDQSQFHGHESLTRRGHARRGGNSWVWGKNDPEGAKRIASQAIDPFSQAPSTPVPVDRLPRHSRVCFARRSAVGDRRRQKPAGYKTVIVGDEEGLERSHKPY